MASLGGLRRRVSAVLNIAETAEWTQRILLFVTGLSGVGGSALAWQRDQSIVFVIAAGVFGMGLAALFVLGVAFTLPRRSDLAIVYADMPPYFVHDAAVTQVRLAVKNVSRSRAIRGARLAAHIVQPPQALPPITPKETNNEPPPYSLSPGEQRTFDILYYYPGADRDNFNFYVGKDIYRVGINDYVIECTATGAGTREESARFRLTKPGPDNACTFKRLPNG
jgi:hypothetical protein